MTTREVIEQVVLESGLWDQGRRASHGFVLSPSVYEVSSAQQQDLDKMALALHECLAGVGRIATIAGNSQIGHTHTWQMIRRVLNTGVPKRYEQLMLHRPGRVPVVCKVDLMEDPDGHYWIAEIDGHNKHGLGYSTLAAQIRSVIAPDRQTYPGVAKTIAKDMKRRRKSRLVLLYGDQERFYLPEFGVLQNELAGHGIELIVVSEIDFDHTTAAQECDLFVDLPFLFRRTELHDQLSQAYLANEIDFLIPPKPFLGSKGVLALLRNDGDDENLEAILRSQISTQSLEVMRQFIPPTFLVSKHRPRAHWNRTINGHPFVLKEVVASGMKGTYFSDSPEFDPMLVRACGSYYRCVLQREVTNRSLPFESFDCHGQSVPGEWFMRVNVHFGVRCVADVVVTARQDREVHGAPDCLQLGSVLV